MSRPDDVASALVRAMAARDDEAAGRLMHDDVRLRALVPSGPIEVEGRADVVARFRRWFGDAQTLDTDSSSFEPVSDRVHAAYRFRATYADGAVEVVEQHAFVDVDDGRVRTVDLVCSGWLPVEASRESDVHAFDAGDMGCSSGLTGEVRRRLLAIPVGDALAVTVRDPSARGDLPALARLLGHTVDEPRPTDDGGYVITVTRRK